MDKPLGISSEPMDAGVQAKEQSLRRHLKGLMALRVLLVTLILGVTAYLQGRLLTTYIETPLVLLYVLCGISYVMTIVFSLLLNRKINIWLQTYTHLIFDVFFVGALIYITNGYDIFPFLFSITIIAGSIILGRRGALLMASLSGFVFGGLLDLQYFKVIPSIGGRIFPIDVVEDLIWTIFSNFSGFFLVALLSGYLSDELRKMGRKLEQKQTDLVDLENLNRSIVENLTSGLLTINSERMITSFNPAAESITGFTFQETFNSSIEKVFPGIADFLSRQNHRWEVQFVRPRDGASLVLGFSCSPLVHQDGQKIGQIVNFQDVTFLRKIQDQVRESDKLAAVGRLAAGIAHEIRNPLAAISGSVQVLRDDLAVEGENRNLMEIVTRETERLNNLIREFLDFAKPKKGSQHLVLLNKLIEEILQACRQKMVKDARTKVNLTAVITPQPIVLHTDPEKVRQVIWNLLTNAIEAMDENGGDVKVELRVDGMDPPNAILEVRDSGPGIKPDVLPFIYEPFFTTKTQGTGLGLAMVRQVVEECGWTIAVDSKPEAGTFFQIVFPVFSGPDQGLQKEMFSS